MLNRQLLKGKIGLLAEEADLVLLLGYKGLSPSARHTWLVTQSAGRRLKREISPEELARLTHRSLVSIKRDLKLLRFNNLVRLTPRGEVQALGTNELDLQFKQSLKAIKVMLTKKNVS